MPAHAENPASVQHADDNPAAPNDDVRLGTIGYRLAAANGDRCARPEMMTGLMLHDLGGYAPEIRSRVAQAYGLGQGFGVLQLIPGSTADRAGLRRGDEIVSVNGADLAGFAPELIGREASSDRTERFNDLLDSALRKGPADLVVRRGVETITVSLAGVQGCGGRFVAVPGNALNAWSDGHYVAVTARMMRFAPDDQELAFVVAHEMSHNILGHSEPENDAGTSSAQGKAAEIEADGMAIELLAQAGFDLTAPARFLRRTARLQWLVLHLGHPGNSRRIRIVNASIAKLQETNRALPTLAAATICAPAPLPIDGSEPTDSKTPNTRGDTATCLSAQGNGFTRSAPMGGDSIGIPSPPEELSPAPPARRAA